MKRITWDETARQQVLKYSAKHSVTETAARYGVSRKTIYKWRNRYDGSLASLRDRSTRPHNSPRKQSEEELRLVERLTKKYGKDRLLAFEVACKKGYSRTYACFKRTAIELEGTKAKKRKTRPNKPYTPADYPGQKVQIDTKMVPMSCCVDGAKRWVFVAKDECSRWTFRQMYDERSTYNARDFLEKLIRTAPFPIRLIQTDNGSEFTNTLLVTKSQHKTLFEQGLLDMGIEYKRIRIATPRHNGKVERQHRIDTLRFYQKLRIFSLDDGRKQLGVYQRHSNGYIMTCLNMRSPNQVLADYHALMW